jgi:predicted Zn-dependent protease
VAHWPRCSTIGWKYDDAGAPQGGDTGMVDDLRKVFDRYAELTGLRFVEGGADIVIGWADLPRGTNAEAGAGLVSETLGDGFLRLSSDADRPRVPGFGSAGRGVTLLHEMAHVLGLGHVSDRSLLMYPVHSPGSPLTPQTGDIAGLKDLYAPATCR